MGDLFDFDSPAIDEPGTPDNQPADDTVAGNEPPVQTGTGEPAGEPQPQVSEPQTGEPQQTAQPVQQVPDNQVAVPKDVYDELMALRQAVVTNPDVLDLLSQKLTGQPVSPAQGIQNVPVGPPQQPGTQPVQPLSPPKPPEDFDPYAVHDPNSPSGRYMVELQRWLSQQTVAPVQQEVKTLQSQLEEMRQLILQQQQKEQMQQFLARERQRIAQQYPDAQQDWDDFLQFASNPENVTTEVLYKLYRLVKGKPISSINKQIQQQTNQNNPPPITKVGGGEPAQVDESDQFFQGMVHGTEFDY